MKSITLTPKERLPEITPEDQEFAEKNAMNFELDKDEVSWFVRDFG